MLNAIKNGLKTKKEILSELQIDKQCWRKTSTKLRNERLIVYESKTWRLRVDE